MEAFEKHMRLGTAPTWGGGRMSVFVMVDWNGERLSITGVAGPTARGNSIGSCGQIFDRLVDVDRFAEGWDADVVAKLADIWRRWHMNHLRAGSQVQLAWLRGLPDADRPLPRAWEG